MQEQLAEKPEEGKAEETTEKTEEAEKPAEGESAEQPKTEDKPETTEVWYNCKDFPLKLGN